MALNKKFFSKVSSGAATDTFTPSKNFNTVLYTGTGAAQRIGGYINRGGVFNGSNSEISITGQLPTSVSSDYAISLYAMADVLGSSGRGLFSNIGAGGSNVIGQVAVVIWNSKLRVYMVTDPSAANFLTVFDSASSLSTGQWYNIIVNVDVSASGTDTMNCFVNGSAFNVTGFANTNVTTNTNTLIGELAGLYYFNGKIDQLRIFNRSLSSSEVTTLNGETFASTTKSTTDIFSDNSGVALYQFDGNANATGSVPEIAFDSTINTSSIAYTVNNRKIAGNTSGSYASTRVTESKSSGKWYFEMYYNDSSYFPSSRGGLGLLCSTCTMTTYLGGTSQDDWAVFNGGNVINNTSSVHNESLGDFSLGNVIMCALDLDNQKVYFGKNGSWFNSANPSNGTNGFTLSGSEYYAAGWVYNTSDQLTFRFREGDFGYTVPTGFSAYSETNYNGTASNVTYQEATKFQPDFVWIKNRDSTTWHNLSDSVRGASKSLFSNSTYQEVDDTGGARAKSFNSNGFTLDGNSNDVNGSDNDYVAWCWKAGGSSTSSNSDGTITTNISANTEAGFNIISYTGNATNGATIGHGLGQQVKLAFFKNRTTGSTYWYVYSDELSGSTYNLYLNSSSGETADNVIQGGNTTTIQISNSTAVNTTSNNYICYAFANIDSYQKIGSYTGDGTTSGHVIETGFEPAVLIIKGVSHGGSWAMLDNKRSTTNPRDEVIYADSDGAESVNDVYVKANFLSNGFELKTNDSGINMSGRTYLYLAIAADPDTTTPTVADSFDIVTYTGNGGTQDIETDFKPDFVWIKARNAAASNMLFDSIRGVSQVVSSESTSLQSDLGSHGLTDFNSNGFSVSDIASGGNGVNGASGGTYSGTPPNYVAWVWKAGDHDDNLPQINTEGTIDSVVSVNDAAGFSIVKYIGTGSATTIGHGLSSAPELIFVKTLDSVDNWMVLSTALGATKKAALNSSNAFDTDSAAWNDTAPTSTVFTVGTKDATNKSGDEFIAYCWYSVTGHSKIGTYTGSGISGKSETTGFRPRWVMTKNTQDSASYDRWYIQDSVRGGGKVLFANDTLAELEFTSMQFDNNGFTLNTNDTGINESGKTYLYLAIA